MLNNMAIKMLSKNHLLNIDMLECIRRGSAEILFASEEGVLLIDIPSQICMISIINSKIAENLICKIPNNTEIIAAHDECTYNLVLQRFKFTKTMVCYNTVYTKNTAIPIKNSIIKIKSLTYKYKDIIMKNYTKADIIDINYIEDRLKANVMLGAFIDNNLCGFVGNHSEGSIGMLEVFPKYRGKGIGMVLQIVATNNALENNRYAYGQVVEDNLASTGLQKKLGFELSKDKVYWLMK